MPCTWNHKVPQKKVCLRSKIQELNMGKPVWVVWWRNFFANLPTVALTNCPPTNRLWKYWSNLDKHQSEANLPNEKKKSTPSLIMFRDASEPDRAKYGHLTTGSLGIHSLLLEIGSPLPTPRYIHFTRWVGVALKLDHCTRSVVDAATFQKYTPQLNCPMCVCSTILCFHSTTGSQLKPLVLNGGRPLSRHKGGAGSLRQIASNWSSRGELWLRPAWRWWQRWCWQSKHLKERFRACLSVCMSEMGMPLRSVFS